MTHIHRLTQSIFFLMLLLAACSAPLTPTAPPPIFTPPPPTPTVPSPTLMAPSSTPAGVNEKVDVGGYSLYLHCEGTGIPTVVLDSGLDVDSSAWVTIIPRIKPFTRVCAYDRAGLGRSDPAPKKPRTSHDMMTDLHNLLTSAHIEGPYVLVGWSISGLNVRVFASEYPQEVIGMVMVDCSHPDEAARFVAALPTQSPYESPELKDFRKYFMESLPNHEGMDVEASAAQVRATGSLDAMPLIVLTAEGTGSGHLDPRLVQAWLDMQNELAGLSSNSTHIVVPNVGHCIQCDAPDVVADAILDVLDATGKWTSSASKLELVWSLMGESNQLDTPQGVAVDAQGNVYVIDSGNLRVQKFDSSGKFLMMWGENGNGDGQFRFTQFRFGFRLAAAIPLAIDVQNNVYVADPLNHRIQNFDTNGQFLTQWGLQGDGDGQFQSPYGVAADAKGNIYVSDFTRNDIQKFDHQGKFLLKWDGQGSESGKFNHPGSITVDAQGNVYVVDYGNNRIQKFDDKGKLLVAWGIHGGGNDDFSAPLAVGMDKSGNVYVLDSGNSRIQKFDSSGSFLASWVTFSEEGFYTPLAMAVDGDGYIYVSDIHDNRVLKLKQP